MTKISWSKRIVKGNSSGAGWITLPIKLRSKETIGNWYKVNLKPESVEQVTLSIKLSKNKASWGFYIPKKICSQNELIGKNVKVTIQRSDYIKGKISEDKRVRIPNDIVNLYSIKKGDIYEMELNVNEKKFKETVVITNIERKERYNDEYYFTIRMQDLPIKIETQFKIVKKIKTINHDKNDKGKSNAMINIPSLFTDAFLGKIAENKMIIFLGNHKPIITPINIEISDIVHYFGCYYADGTKKGYGWSISASTPEQAKYYIEIYNSIVVNNKLSFNLTYTQKNSDSREIYEIKNYLASYWKNFGIEILHERIYIIKTDVDYSLKSNKYGSLRIRDYRSLVMKIHLRIMKSLENLVLTTNNEKNIWEFLFGIMEGDGYVSGGEKRFGLSIACHENDKIIRNALEKLNITFNVDYDQVKRNISSGIRINFGLFQVLLNLEIISKKVFKYYPKRRKIFINRILEQSTVKYLMKRKAKLSTFSLSFIEKNCLDARSFLQILEELLLEKRKITK